MSSSWRELYKAALVELQPAELRRRIEAAEKAIHARTQELGSRSSVSSEELQALEDALCSLRVLARTEGLPTKAHQPTPGGRVAQ